MMCDSHSLTTVLPRPQDGCHPLSPEVIARSSYYTNGQYLFIVDNLQTPGLSWCFALRDGRLVGRHLLDNFSSLTPLATCYDYRSNAIWTFTSQEFEIVQYRNEGLAPKHTFPDGI
jgi:hypothetical protein